MNQHFHDLPRFRDPPEPKRGPSIEGYQVWIYVEEIFLGDYALIHAAKVWATGVDDASDDGAAFTIDAITVCGWGSEKPLSKDDPFEAVLWNAIVQCVEGSVEYCDEIMTLLEEAAS